MQNIDNNKIYEAYIVVSKMFPKCRVVLNIEKQSTSSTCDTCKHVNFRGWMKECQNAAWNMLADGSTDSYMDDGFCCNRYELKE